MKTAEIAEKYGFPTVDFVTFTEIQTEVKKLGLLGNAI